MQGSGQIGGLLTMTRAKTPYLPTYPQAAQRSEKRRKIGGTYLLQGPLAWGGVVKTGPTYCIGCLAQTPYLARSRNPVYTRSKAAACAAAAGGGEGAICLLEAPAQGRSDTCRDT